MRTPIDNIMDEVNRKLASVMQQREEILTAFVAKYGCQPDELIQIEWRKSRTETIWFVKPRDIYVCDKCKSVTEKLNEQC